MKLQLVPDRPATLQRAATRKTWKRLLALCVSIMWGGAVTHSDCQGGDWNEEAVALIHAANEVHNADWERLKHVQVEGRLEFLSADKKVFWVCKTSFEVSELNLWMSIINDTVEPPKSRRYREVEFVADGQAIAATNRSERIKPAGCETAIMTDDITGFQITTGSHEIDPRKTIVPRFLRGDSVAGYKKRSAEVRFRKDESGNSEREVEVVESGTVQRFVFSPDLSNRLIYYSLSSAQDEPTWIYRYTYDSSAGGVIPTSITVDLFDFNERKGFHSCKLRIEKIVPQASGLPFSLSRLKICENSRVLDHRPNAGTPVRNSSPSAIQSMPTAPIDAQVQALPDRYQIPDRQPLPESRRGWSWLLIVLNATIVVAAISYLWTKTRRKQ